jgi:S-adenosylmethionine decarboxylase
MNKSFLGKQWIIELYGCSSNKLNDQDFVRETMLQAARISKATIIKDVFHSFNPQGLSGVVVISESHFAIHTWPEHSCASIDIFSCGDLDVESSLEFLKESFQPLKLEISTFHRGCMKKAELKKNSPFQSI